MKYLLNSLSIVPFAFLYFFTGFFLVYGSKIVLALFFFYLVWFVKLLMRFSH